MRPAGQRGTTLAEGLWGTQAHLSQAYASSAGYSVASRPYLRKLFPQINTAKPWKEQN